MNLMKKSLAVLLAACMLLTVLAGCGSNNANSTSDASANTTNTPDDTANESAKGEDNTSAEPTIITLWAYQNDSWVAAYEEVIAAFEKEYPQYKVEMTLWPYGDFSDKVTTSLMPGAESADVYLLWADWIYDALGTGVLSEVPESLAADLESDYMPAAKTGFNYKGTYYGVPLESNCEYGGMVVNKHLFGDNGYTYPTTWEELRQISGEVAVKNSDVMEMRGFDCIEWDALLMNYLAMILQQGGEYILEDGSCDFTTPEAIKAFEEIKSMVIDGENSLETITDWATTWKPVFNGVSYMGSVGTWALANLEKNELVYGEDIEYVPVPQYGEELRYAAETGWGLIVPEKAEQKDAGWALVEYWSSPEVLKQFNIACSQLPARESIAQDEEFRAASSEYEFVLDLLPHGEWIGPYDTTAMRYAIINTLISVCTTNDYASTEEALQAMTDEINTTVMDR